ncbi:MAG: deoxyribodipyrimidine photolyase, partial [Armatimonadetes bacterium]|nr:deoxyribodipyrimidine photolyase [Armatimonadota bacterium]
MPAGPTNSVIPAVRIDVCSDCGADRSGHYVLYWMLACRRIGWNFGLQRAVEWAVELGKPLVIVEDLRCGGRWDSNRSHFFALQAMAEHADGLASRPVLY